MKSDCSSVELVTSPGVADCSWPGPACAGTTAYSSDSDPLTPTAGGTLMTAVSPETLKAGTPAEAEKVVIVNIGRYTVLLYATTSGSSDTVPVVDGYDVLHAGAPPAPAHTLTENVTFVPLAGRASSRPVNEPAASVTTVPSDDDTGTFEMGCPDETSRTTPDTYGDGGEYASGGGGGVITHFPLPHTAPRTTTSATAVMADTMSSAATAGVRADFAGAGVAVASLAAALAAVAGAAMAVELRCCERKRACVRTVAG